MVGRELNRFLRQPSRLGSALVRPLLWFVVFSAGFSNVFGVAIVPPYETYIEYKAYMVPGLLGMVALFNGMQSSLSMVYDREMGVMRLLLTAPLARGWLLAFKLLHAGGRLVFAPDGKLFVTLGERSIMAGRVQARDLKSHFGKIVPQMQT